jgi:hypothetical protein
MRTLEESAELERLEGIAQSGKTRRGLRVIRRRAVLRAYGVSGAPGPVASLPCLQGGSWAFLLERRSAPAP